MVCMNRPLHNLSVSICSLRYLACNAHMPFCYLWSAPLYDIFPNYFKNVTIFEWPYRTRNVCFDFLYKFCYSISHSKKKWTRYDQKRILVFMESALYSCPILMKLEYSRQILEKSSNTKFHENPSSGSRVFPCGRTEGRTDMRKLIVAFRNFVNAPKICHDLNLLWSKKRRWHTLKYFLFSIWGPA